MNFIIPYIIYPFDLMVSFGENDYQIECLLKKNNVIYDGAEWLLAPFAKGRCCMFVSGQTIIRMPSKPKTNEDFGILQHEIFHAVEFLFDRIGIKHSIECGEAYAYLIGYITEEIYKKL